MKAPSQRYKYFKKKVSRYQEGLPASSRIRLTNQTIQKIFINQPRTKTQIHEQLKELTYLLAWLTPTINRYCDDQTNYDCHLILHRLSFRLDNFAIHSMLLKRGEDLCEFNKKRLEPCICDVVATIAEIEELINRKAFDEVQ
jgi:hypothetical protein